MNILQRRALATLLCAGIALPSAALAAYTPGTNDQMTVRDAANVGHVVNAQSYIGTQSATFNAGCTAAAPPTVTSFGTGNTVVAYTTSCTIEINVGTSNSGAGTITLPAAPHGWFCPTEDVTTVSATVYIQKENAYTTTTCVIQNYSDAAATHAMVDSDILLVHAFAF